MARRIAVIFIFLSLFALLGLGYVQFSSDTAWVAARTIRKNTRITADDVTQISFAKLRDKKAAALVITDKNKVVGKYATADIRANTLFVNNGMLSDKPPAGRCFSTGRCLPEGYTAWMFTGTEQDTLGGTITANDLLDIVLVDTKNKQVTTLVQKIKPLEKKNNVFIFAFTPQQVAILNGIQGAQATDTEGVGALHLTLQLNQNPNPPQALLQRYSMDYTAIPPNLFPLPEETPVPTPALQGDN